MIQLTDPGPDCGAIDATEYIFGKQLLWARRKRLLLCGSAGDRGRLAYTRRLSDNLFEPLCVDAEREYRGADGGELGREAGRPGKMQAVHSSSALGCNTFHYWRRIGHMGTALHSCGLPTDVNGTTFEGRLPISERYRYAPNLDVLVTHTDGTVSAIECKFGEPFGARQKPTLSGRYLDDTASALWHAVPALRDLAIHGQTQFTKLDVPQLLKHILGLTRRCGTRGRLLYLYYDVPFQDGVTHRDEIARFREVARTDGVAFSALSYQTLILRLAADYSAHHGWIDYMAERYL